MNIIEHLISLEKKIYAADGHEARKHHAQMQEQLYLAWPELLAVVESIQNGKKSGFDFIKCNDDGSYAYRPFEEALAALLEDE
jgi:hypothetical protein